MEKKKFTLPDQLMFAKISGDRNPLHIEPTYARRTMVGEVAIHGVHSILWVLNSILKETPSNVILSQLSATFHKPMVLNKDLVSSQETKSKLTKLKIYQDEKLCTIIKCKWTKSDFSLDFQPLPGIPPKSTPKEIDQIIKVGTSGALPIFMPKNEVFEAFPYISKKLPAYQIANILTSTRLVGMECPGLNSLYSELNFTFCQATECFQFNYRISKQDERSHQLTMEVEAPGTRGLIYSFIRPKPIQQVSFAAIKSQITPEEFANQKALVIGGSRGLGEIATKILVAGGAEVCFSYHKGQAEAETMVQDIKKSGSKVAAIAYDVLCPKNIIQLNDDSNWSPSHLYYFATPFIFSGSRGSLSEERFFSFLQYYVLRFYTIVNSFQSKGLKSIFYPSTVAVDELPLDMMEYTIAKKAGETLCKFLKKKKNLNVYYSRLPRVATDQTATVYAVKNQEPFPIILKEIRNFLSKKGT